MACANWSISLKTSCRLVSKSLYVSCNSTIFCSWAFCSCSYCVLSLQMEKTHWCKSHKVTGNHANTDLRHLRYVLSLLCCNSFHNWQCQDQVQVTIFQGQDQVLSLDWWSQSHHLVNPIIWIWFELTHTLITNVFKRFLISNYQLQSINQLHTCNNYSISQSSL